MSRLKYYVSKEQFGAEADHVARVLQEAYPAVGIGVGLANQTSKPQNKEEEAKLVQVRALAERLETQMKGRDSNAIPSKGGE